MADKVKLETEIGVVEAAKKIAGKDFDKLGKIATLLAAADNEYGNKNDMISADELQKAADNMRSTMSNGEYRPTGNEDINKALRSKLAEGFAQPFEDLKAQLFPSQPETKDTGKTK